MWNAHAIDRPALQGLKRIQSSLITKVRECLSCENRFNGSGLTAHICPSCGSSNVREVSR